MTDERWQKLLNQLEDDDRIESRLTEDLEGRPGIVERVIVKTPLGRFRLSRTTEPKRLAEKAFYSKRGGSTVSIQAAYDESEQIHIFTVESFSNAGGTWIRVDPEHFVL